MLVDQDDANVLSLLGEAVEGRLDSGVVRLGVNNEEVLLRIGASGDMLRTKLDPHFDNFQIGEILTPMPARSSPVTES